MGGSERVVELEAKVFSFSGGAHSRRDSDHRCTGGPSGISRRRLGYEGELQTANDKWRAAVATMLISCTAIGIAGPTGVGDAVTPKLRRLLAHFVTHWTHFLAKPGIPSNTPRMQRRKRESSLRTRDRSRRSYNRERGHPKAQRPGVYQGQRGCNAHGHASGYGPAARCRIYQARCGAPAGIFRLARGNVQPRRCIRREVWWSRGPVGRMSDED